MKIYNKIALLFLVLISSLLVQPQRISSGELEIKLVKSEWTKAELVALIDKTAATHKVSAIVMHKVVSCESGYNPKNHYRTPREDSWGLVQINRMAHPYITKEQAIDPIFATEFLAKNLAKGKGRMWSCYSKFYG